MDGGRPARIGVPFPSCQERVQGRSAVVDHECTGGGRASHGGGGTYSTFGDGHSDMQVHRQWALCIGIACGASVPRGTRLPAARCCLSAKLNLAARDRSELRACVLASALDWWAKRGLTGLRAVPSARGEGPRTLTLFPSAGAGGQVRTPASTVERRGSHAVTSWTASIHDELDGEVSCRGREQEGSMHTVTANNDAAPKRGR